MNDQGDLFSGPLRPPQQQPPEPPEPPGEVTGIPLEVLSLFEKLAAELLARGWEHYSADAILHRIRWHFHVERGNREFKCNDHWTSQLARWWLKRHPQYPDFFELRALAHERRHRDDWEEDE